MDELSKSSEEPTPKPDEIEPVGELAPKPEEGSVAQPEVSGEPETESVLKLAEPSKELAARLLGKVSFQERLIGTTMHQTAGSIDVALYTFEDAAGFMSVDVGDFMVRNSGSIGYINQDVLKKWVGETLGDTELAGAIEVKIKEGSSYKERMGSINELMEQRLKQCKKVIGGMTEA